MKETKNAVSEARNRAFDGLHQSLGTKNKGKIFTDLLKVGKEKQQTRIK